MSASSLRQLRWSSPALVLKLDPELAADVSPRDRSQAVEVSMAPVCVLSRGEWHFDPAPDAAALGALILKGMVLLRMEFGAQRHLEVLGEGDVINPWQIGEEGTLREQVSVHVVQPASVALLDSRFASAMTPWPEVFAALMRRQIMRVRRMIVQACILSQPRAEDRLELMLWRLADQFGTVTRDGLMVRLPFTHLQLAEMIAVRRPTVTVAVGQLVHEDRLRRPGRNQWLLPHHELTRLTERSAESQLGSPEGQ